MTDIVAESVQQAITALEQGRDVLLQDGDLAWLRQIMSERAAVEPPRNVMVVEFPDPPYELLGDSGQIECPMCGGEGMIGPPENRA